MAGAEELVRQSEEEEMRSSITPFNLEDETVVPLDARETISALRVAGK
jgi:hypothetical protein